ncbi:unnamed protein product, partial [marine sediment metagenome]
LTAMILIAILEAFAIAYQIDGATLGLAFAAIAGLGGYQLGVYRKK